MATTHTRETPAAHLNMSSDDQDLLAIVGASSILHLASSLTHALPLHSSPRCQPKFSHTPAPPPPPSSATSTPPHSPSANTSTTPPGCPNRFAQSHRRHLHHQQRSSFPARRTASSATQNGSCSTSTGIAPSQPPRSSFSVQAATYIGRSGGRID